MLRGGALQSVEVSGLVRTTRNSPSWLLPRRSTVPGLDAESLYRNAGPRTDRRHRSESPTNSRAWRAVRSFRPLAIAFFRAPAQQSGIMAVFGFPEWVVGLIALLIVLAIVYLVISSLGEEGEMLDLALELLD